MDYDKVKGMYFFFFPWEGVSKLKLDKVETLENLVLLILNLYKFNKKEDSVGWEVK